MTFTPHAHRSDRAEIRRMQRERVRANEKKLREKYGIPKAFAQHARRHGSDVMGIVSDGIKWGKFKHVPE